ncbi:FCPB [Symbiodinium sp. KB8]|nr:FCPB [Symbiodinium sp. KB8]
MAHDAPPNPGPDDAVLRALLQLQEDGDLAKFLEVKSDLSQEIQTSEFRSTTPFAALLKGLTKAKCLSSPSGMAAIKRAVSEFGAYWTLLSGLIQLRAVAQGRELVDFAVATGARWGQDGHVVFRGDYAFQTMVPLIMEAELLDEPASMELLERSLAECGRENVMGVLLEGGGTIFSELVSDAVSHGILGTPKGDALINLAMEYGADWACLDGWNFTPFEEITRLPLMSNPRRKTTIPPEVALAYARKVLQNHPQPGLLWNGSKDRTEDGDEESLGAFRSLLRSLAQEKRIGQPISHEFLKMAEETGARNYTPPWGGLTTFHSFVQDLAQAGALRHPEGVDMVARALENGADYRMGDPQPPGKKRIVVDIPGLVWGCRRETVRLLALLASGRAFPCEPDREGSEGNLVASLVALAQFVQAAQHTSALQVWHPIVKSILGFLPRIPPVLGYEFTDFRKVAHHPQMASKRCGAAVGAAVGLAGAAEHWMSKVYLMSPFQAFLCCSCDYPTALSSFCSKDFFRCVAAGSAFLAGTGRMLTDVAPSSSSSATHFAAASIVASAGALYASSGRKVAKGNFSVTALKAFESELGVQAPVGFWDPLGLSSDGDAEVFARRREVELKHGRISMFATIGYIVPEYFRWKLGLKFTDIPNGLAALTKVPGQGWGQIVAFLGTYELFINKPAAGQVFRTLKAFKRVLKFRAVVAAAVSSGVDSLGCAPQFR